MPLCPQITNTPITVVLNADFTVTSVIPVLAANTEQLAATDAATAAAVAAANAAAVAAGIAQTDAATALANASTALTTAQNSLQPSAFAIQDPTTKQLSSIDATGLTVYSGASPTSGARVVLNSTGLAGFNAGGTATFSVSASTGAAVFAGDVTGATITGGTLNIAGNAIINASGLLTATGATITGTINATAGFFGTAINGFSISSTGLVGVGSGLIVGGTIQTSSGSNAIVLDGANNALGIKNSGTFAGFLIGIGSGAFIMHHGTSPNINGYPRTSVSATTASLAADPSNSISITTSGNNVQGAIAFGSNLTAQSFLINTGIQIQNGTAVHITSGGRFIQSTSSERFKKNIVSIVEGGWLDKVTQIRPVNFQYDEAYSQAPDEVISGLIAEDIAEIPGFEHLIYNDPLGDPFSLSYERLTVFLVLAIKELKAEIDTLKGA